MRGVSGGHGVSSACGGEGAIGDAQPVSIQANIAVDRALDNPRGIIMDISGGLLQQRQLVLEIARLFPVACGLRIELRPIRRSAIVPAFYVGCTAACSKDGERQRQASDWVHRRAMPQAAARDWRAHAARYSIR